MTFTGVDDSVLNFPPQHRRTTITYTASGGNYDGVQHPVTVWALDDEPNRYTVQEGRSYTLKFDYVVTQGCAPVVMTLVVSDPSVLSVDPPTLTWTEQDSGTHKAVALTFHDNDALEDGSVTLSRPFTQPCGGGIPFQDIIFTVLNDDTAKLSVDAIPACGTTVTDNERPSYNLVLAPAPDAMVETEYAVVPDNTEPRWLSVFN